MLEQTARLAQHIRTELGKVVVGQTEALDQLLLVLISGGHALVEGVPGLAKTLAVKALARSLKLDFHRVQCTPDLMPADVLGTNIYQSGSGQFVLHRGPVFTDLLLVDEINRTPPRTQSALLEAMEERQVTLDGKPHALSGHFAVFATQNPIEFEGTYPLPEAQLDRFLMKIRMGYPAADEEVRILERFQGGFDAHQLDRLGITSADSQWIAATRKEVQSVRVEPALLKYVSAVARRTRDWPALTLGASPRAAIGLLLVARGLAAMDGRDYLLPDDVKSAALPVFRHRLVLKPEADLEGLTADQVIESVLKAVEVPR